MIRPLLFFLSVSLFSAAESPFRSDLSLKSIDKVSDAVADWQMKNPPWRPGWHWANGALWTGLTVHADSTGDEKYFRYLDQVSKDIDYSLGPRLFNADDHCVGQLHLWHYLRDERPEQLAKTAKGMTNFINLPHKESLEWVNHVKERELAWCDALYMGPPTLAMLYSATGDMRYLDKMDRLWWKTTDYLYHQEEHLFFRDSKYFDDKEANGENVYWSRGNGWVFAGLSRILEHMPRDYPSRGKYVSLFQEMAAKLKNLQTADGSWRASLLDPDSFSAPESSGTAFFAYGFMWGINHGVLSKEEYLAPSLKAWNRLVKNIHADGKVGFVQPIGENPKNVSHEMTDVYGVGSFLLVAHELRNYLILETASLKKVQAQSSSDWVRLNEVVSLPWTTAGSQIAVRDEMRGLFLPSQLIDADQDGTPEELIFIVDFAPKETRSFQILTLGENRPHARKSQNFARYVPERKDDFAWENNRVAFRAYGPALAAENATGGFDVWSKSVRTPIVNAWYASGDYHQDHGTGLDGYKVGPSLGCGGLGYLDQDKVIHPSPVFESHEILYTGPVRQSFRLTYPELAIGAAKIRETRTITMDAGSHAFRVDSHFDVKGDASGLVPIAGIVNRNKEKRFTVGSGDLLGYWDPAMKKQGKGYIGTFVMNSSGEPTWPERNGTHFYKTLGKDLAAPVHYWTGALWSEAEGLDKGGFSTRLLQMSFDQSSPIKILSQ